MTVTQADQGQSIDQVIGAIADERRRTCLAVLGDRDGSVPATDLAAEVAARSRGVSLIDVSDDHHRQVLTDLVHAQLPALAEADLVDWDRDAGVVAAVDHPALTGGAVGDLLTVEYDGWDEVLSALSDARRRRALAVLADAGEVDRDDLVRRVLAGERDCEPDAVSDRDVADAAVEFHHVHLPVLQRAALLAYDGDAAEYLGHPALDVDEIPLTADAPAAWADDSDEATTGVDATDGTTADDVRTIDGRADVIDRGQSLIDGAEEELFLMITTDGLLEEACVEKLRAAADRGVDVYVGSQTAAVRDLVREEVPDAVIWEPQLDWMNFPPRRERVGRLVFADREAVMVGTLGRETDAGVRRETAITGEGAGNTLVLLLRELLGSRLDHLDEQSPDFRSQIPL
ncbi:DUF7344 domain-containing protein [Halomicrobium salinisoli]|uniref:DUF7344 domain-containing protein n=1 Tax=Halomicrobium salinisoli TaxID=2878391 RepID=UPI001CF0711C|nr:TrmB family transcriptional regulator sugar-binding domain-containing protein [Halomicrobium salinisoli]